MVTGTVCVINHASLCPVSAETWQEWFKLWLMEMKSEIIPAEHCELSLCLTGDEEIEQLNFQYRQQKRPTDVLAFVTSDVSVPVPMDMSYQQEPFYLGDIVISLETALRQAQEQNHSLTIELAWLAAHGLLHLLGWDHPDETSLRQMLTQQQRLMQKVDLFVQYC